MTSDEAGSEVAREKIALLAAEATVPVAESAALCASEK
jgi:hypothetical protein